MTTAGRSGRLQSMETKMGRATDLCTCGHDRTTYHAAGQCWAMNHAASRCSCKQFFPHPQPPAREIEVPFPDLLVDWASGKGAVKLGDADTFFVQLPNGQLWEVRAVLRKDTKANPGGV